nr:MAG TPA: hypothetical protein [Caudoviricetes sp.]
MLRLTIDCTAPDGSLQGSRRPSPWRWNARETADWSRWTKYRTKLGWRM